MKMDHGGRGMCPGAPMLPILKKGTAKHLCSTPKLDQVHGEDCLLKVTDMWQEEWYGFGSVLSFGEGGEEGGTVRFGRARKRGV